MPVLAFKQPIREGDVGLDVAAVKRALRRLRYGPLRRDRRMRHTAVLELARFQKKHHLHADGVYGPATHRILAAKFTAYERLLYRRARLRAHARQTPKLPRFFYRPTCVSLPGRGRWGLQPWIVPQVEAICAHFNVSVTSGYGGHPPHATCSDHRWGGAVDLAGTLDAMRAVNVWADGQRGVVFRWVGGPARDLDGVEPGHYNHCHVSWFNRRATTIFGRAPFA